MPDVKIVVLGGRCVGKSALTIQMVQKHFVEEYDSTIENSYRKQILVGKNQCILDILDTGEVGYSAMRDQYARTGEGFIMTYSITDRRSFDELAEFYHHVVQVKKTTSIACILVGNKCDLTMTRQVSEEEAKELAKHFDNCPFFETSAKERTNVHEIFHECTKQISKKIHNRNTSNPPYPHKNKNCSFM